MLPPSCRLKKIYFFSIFFSPHFNNVFIRLRDILVCHINFLCVCVTQTFIYLFIFYFTNYFFIIFGCAESSLWCAEFSLRWFPCCRAQALDAQASVVAAHALSCSKASRIVPDQGSNLHPLLWKADFQLPAPGKSLVSNLKWPEF